MFTDSIPIVFFFEKIKADPRALLKKNKGRVSCFSKEIKLILWKKKISKTFEIIQESSIFQESSNFNQLIN
jgi:hypothetical protein